MIPVLFLPDGMMQTTSTTNAIWRFLISAGPQNLPFNDPSADYRILNNEKADSFEDEFTSHSAESLIQDLLPGSQ